MRYLLLIYADETTWTDATPEEIEAMMVAHGAFSEATGAEGILRGGEALQPTTTATTVRVRDGEAMLTDGPFAEAREQLGGFYIVECDTLDEAIGAARRVPEALHGAVEVRPIMEFDG
ncbi:MAG: YciI family protein [Thermoleophilia bacterium]